MGIRLVGQIARRPSPLPPPLLPTITAIGQILPSGFDANFGGKYELVGTTKIRGTPPSPVRVRVSLHDQLTGLLVRSQWSDPLTGAYAFDLIKNVKYYVVAFDHTGFNRAVIADSQTPEAM